MCFCNHTNGRVFRLEHLLKNGSQLIHHIEIKRLTLLHLFTDLFCKDIFPTLLNKCKISNNNIILSIWKEETKICHTY